MITKFKIFEAWKLFFPNKNVPQKRDYVICNRQFAFKTDDPLFKVDEFINNNVGQIVKIEHLGGIKWYYVEYYNIPKELWSEFYLNDSTLMQLKHIKYFSKNKENLEAILTANKFNI